MQNFEIITFLNNGVLVRDVNTWEEKFLEDNYPEEYLKEINTNTEK